MKKLLLSWGFPAVMLALAILLLALPAWADGPIAHATTAVSCPTASSIATAIPASTPAPGETSGMPNRLCTVMQDQDSTNAVLILDCGTAATIMKLYASGAAGTAIVAVQSVGKDVSGDSDLVRATSSAPPPRRYVSVRVAPAPS